MEMELEALELLAEEQGLTGGGCDIMTCGLFSCGVLSCGYISCGYSTCGFSTEVVIVQ